MTVHRILHLSDTHLRHPDVDAAAALAGILHDLRHLSGLDLVVVSGDLADDGSAEGCAGVREQVGRFCAERGIPHYYCTGNHDTREAFTEVFGSGHVAADGTDLGARMPGTERAAVSELGGLRVITLDSLVPGAVYGELGEAQLAWLREVLATPAPAGSVVILHHPPLTVPTSLVMDRVNLRDAAALADAVRGTDVRMILCGHFHLQLSGLLAGVPVWVTPGVVSRIDLSTSPGLLRVVRGGGASVVELGGPASPVGHVLHARDPRAGELLQLVDATSGQDAVEAP